MLRSTLLLLFLMAAPKPATVPSGHAPAESAAAKDAPTYTADGELKLPESYREWIFLSSGVDMSYSPNAAMTGHSTFDNVFVNPSSYHVFQKTGTWPDKTTLVLEVRAAEGASSINKRGHTQSAEITGLEMHVKDARLEGGWGFYEVTGGGSAKLIKRPAVCYQCHESHGATDTTFVQFYPTLRETAQAKGTLSAAYLKEIGTAKTDK